MKLINIADLRPEDDPLGRSYREINRAKTHAIPVGALVEAEPIEGSGYKNGIRLYVVSHGRDCDETPLYHLSAYADDTVQEREGWLNRSWTGGRSEDSLTVIELPSEA
jgi:hypothetical protein